MGDFMSKHNNLNENKNKLKDKSKEGYNFVKSLEQWTTPEQQKIKVKEIEKVTDKESLNVKQSENNNYGQWTKK